MGTFIQPMLPKFGSSIPAVAALHPPNALFMFWMAVQVARRVTAAASSLPAASSVDSGTKVPGQRDTPH
jgi:hypothetical protein